MDLNDNYRIIYDSENTILQFFELREKLIKDEITKKFVGTGEFKEFTENFYYPNLKQALIAFLNKATHSFETANEILTEIKKVELLILNIK